MHLYNSSGKVVETFVVAERLVYRNVLISVWVERVEGRVDNYQLQ